VHGVNNVSRTEMHTVEPSLPECSFVDIHIAAEKFKRYKSSGIGQIPTQLIDAGAKTFVSEIHSLILFVMIKNCHSSGKYQLLLYLFIKMATKLV